MSSWNNVYRGDISPCKKCQTRYENCHDNCDDYKSWKQDLEDAKKIIIDAKNKDKIVNGHYIDVSYRIRKGTWR